MQPVSILGIIALALQAVIAIPKIGAMVEGWVAKYLAWKHQKELEEVQGKITDAKDATKAAETKEDRINAAKKWQEALSKSRPSTPSP